MLQLVVFTFVSWKSCLLAEYLRTEVGSISSELPVEFRRLENVEYRNDDDDAMSTFFTDVMIGFDVLIGFVDNLENELDSLTSVKVARLRW